MSFTIGKEGSMTLTIVDPISQQSVPILSVGKVKNFSVEMNHETTKVEQITDGGEVSARDSFHGWNISFTVTRNSGMLSKIAQIYQDNYLNGGRQIYATFNETVTNPDGTIDQYQYPKSVPNFKSLGNFEGGGKEVDQTFTAFCPKRKEIATTAVFG